MEAKYRIRMATEPLALMIRLCRFVSHLPYIPLLHRILLSNPQVDFERNGQISSDTLHKHLVSALPRNSVLHILFDCCHSGSAVELPFVYRTDEDGNINLVDNLKQGFALVGEATNLIQGGFRMDRMQDAEQLYAGASSFFKGLMHQGGGEGEDGLQKEDFEEDWSHEGKSVFMVSFWSTSSGLFLPSGSR
jgi:hypothetical protein